MDFIVATTFSSVVAAVLWSNMKNTMLHTLFFAILIFVVAFVGIKISKALVAPYISPLKNVPGPRDNQILFGQALKIFRAPGPIDLYLKWMRKWPDSHFIRQLSFGNSEIMLVNSLQAHKEVMQTKADFFVKPGYYETLLGEVVGRGVLFSIGDEHRLQRRFLAGPFSSPNIRKLLPIFQDKSRDLTSLLERNIDGETGGTVEIESIFTKTTLDIIGVTMLGIELNTLTSTSKSSTLNFEDSFHHVVEQSFLGFLIMFLNAFIMPLRWLPVTANQNFVKAKTALWTISRQLVGKRFKEVEARKDTNSGDGNSGGRDLLTYMVEANLSSNETLSRTQIIEDTIQFILAGHETSAGSLTWTIYALAMDQDLQKRVRREILDATSTGLVEADYATIEGMHLLNNVIRESLRLYSPGLFIPREAAVDVVIAGTLIPKGTNVTMVPAMMQQNPLIWGEDADQYKPDRWDNLSTEAASPYAFTAFSGGPRVCIGRSFALLEIKAILVELLSRFVFEPVDLNPKYLNPALTLRPEGGLKVRVRRA